MPAPGMDVCEAVRAVWAEMGARVVTVHRGGLEVSYANHYALRVGLHGVDDYIISRMLQNIAVSWCRSAKIHATTTSIYAARRAHASGKGSETKKWVYVAAGRGDDTSMEQLRLEMQSLGLIVTLVPAPLITASTGGK